MTTRVTLRDRFRYRFDNLMSRGTGALIGWLALLSLFLVLVSAAMISALGIFPGEESTVPFSQAAWQSLGLTMDPGLPEEGGWDYRLLMTVVAIGGLFITSTLIGLLTSGIEEKFDNLRKGRSRVIESGHTVILGWSQSVFAIISELVEAKANQRRACIVILGDKDKVEMEDEIRANVRSTANTRVVCRTGNPIEFEDLALVSPQSARAVIIPSPEGEDPDSQVIKTLMAVTHLPHDPKAPHHIVAEIRDPKNQTVARLAGGAEAEIILTGDLIARVVAQTCRQSGLSVVYVELLNFSGDEFYIAEVPALRGKTFGEALGHFEKCALAGIQRKNAAPQLSPPMDTRLAQGDQLILIAADDDRIEFSPGPGSPQNPTAIELREPAKPTPEQTLILGWNWRGPRIIAELDAYVAPGSSVLVAAELSEGEADLLEHLPPIKNQTVTARQVDITDRGVLDSLNVPAFKHVIVLSCFERLEPQRADAVTLITLLHLRDIAEKTNARFSIVSEMLDVKNRALAEVTKVDDFIVSDKLVSMMLAQVSETKALNAVFADLFDPEGAEVYLKLAKNYLHTGEPVNFYTVVEAARRRNEVAIGYKRFSESQDGSRSYGVRINPAKSEQIVFEEWDRIVVLADSST